MSNGNFPKGLGGINFSIGERSIRIYINNSLLLIIHFRIFAFHRGRGSVRELWAIPEICGVISNTVATPTGFVKNFHTFFCYMSSGSLKAHWR